MLTTAGASVLQRRLALSRTLETAVGCLSTSMRERLSGVVLIVLFAALVTAALSAALFLIITRLSSGEGGDSSESEWLGSNLVSVLCIASIVGAAMCFGIGTCVWIAVLQRCKNRLPPWCVICMECNCGAGEHDHGEEEDDFDYAYGGGGDGGDEDEADDVDDDDERFAREAGTLERGGDGRADNLEEAADARYRRSRVAAAVSVLTTPPRSKRGPRFWKIQGEDEDEEEKTALGGVEMTSQSKDVSNVDGAPTPASKTKSVPPPAPPLSHTRRDVDEEERRAWRESGSLSESEHSDGGDGAATCPATAVLRTSGLSQSPTAVTLAPAGVEARND